MSVFNRRNAVVGWVAWSVGKRILRRKARDVKPSLDPESRRPNRSAVALAVAGVLGLVTFWRRRPGGEPED